MAQLVGKIAIALGLALLTAGVYAWGLRDPGSDWCEAGDDDES